LIRQKDWTKIWVLYTLGIGLVFIGFVIGWVIGGYWGGIAVVFIPFIAMIPGFACVVISERKCRCPHCNKMIYFRLIRLLTREEGCHCIYCGGKLEISKD